MLVDITPHTLGIKALGELHGFRSSHRFAPIIHRNTPLPATRSEIFSTVVDRPAGGRDRRLPGRERRHPLQPPVGEFLIEGLAEVPAGNQIVVRLDLTSTASSR